MTHLVPEEIFTEKLNPWHCPNMLPEGTGLEFSFLTFVFSKGLQDVMAPEKTGNMLLYDQS